LAVRIEREGIPAFVAYWEQLPLWASQASLPAEVCQRLHEQRLVNIPLGLAHRLRGMGTGALDGKFGGINAAIAAVRRQVVGSIRKNDLGIGERHVILCRTWSDHLL
jgi:2-succinyl-6-hydroxy-2,4-cyclohexadiene-1-carboxylate synthase